MVSFIIYDDNILFPSDRFEDTRKHSSYTFFKYIFFDNSSIFQRRTYCQLYSLLKRMEVCDDDISPAEHISKPCRYNITSFVIISRLSWFEHIETISNGNSRCDDDKGIRKTSILTICDFIECLPSYNHRHDDSFS